MAIQHKNITEADLHEPKGVSTASSGTVYKANGAGTGAWSYPIVGQNTALSGQVFVSNGANSGTWSYPPAKGHAEIYINSGATTHTLGSAQSYTKLNPSGEWTASGYEDVISVDAVNGEIDLDLAGHYKIDFWCTFTTAALASGTLYRFKFAIDGVVSNRILTVQKFSNGVDTLHVAATGLVEATAGQALSIHVAGDATSSSTNITPLEAGLVALHLD